MKSRRIAMFFSALLAFADMATCVDNQQGLQLKAYQSSEVRHATGNAAGTSGSRRRVSPGGFRLRIKSANGGPDVRLDHTGGASSFTVRVFDTADPKGSAASVHVASTET
eukprot:gnl/TRDRNA2_/TRDRNA2_185574_c0_seq1.p1 gnl/TRDRNA2_/TRDRNA2_185574_c0~~gnl/TRDRNA2_/TRDRNA2_185574_c0_seq1.p1  ORF type:complete len:110 (+),score=17.48 gnl/TRDRNA2_/TRDRNA2_185574_c0_seq1:101-430(+)